jgi:DNA replication protein DnaC
MLQQPILRLLHELRLPGMAAALEEQRGMPDLRELAFEDRLALLLEREQTERADRRLQRLARTQLLILDVWGMAGLDDLGRGDLLEVLDDRYGRRATLVTSQIPVEEWHEIVGDATFGDAILDRLVHNAHRIPLKGGSMRRVYDSTKEPDPRTNSTN